MTTATETVKNSGETEKNQEESIQFTEAQQKKLNEIIESRLARQGKELKSQNETYKSQIANLTKELEEAKQAVKEAKTPAEKIEAQDNVDLIKNELDEVKRGNKKLQEKEGELLKKLEEYDRKIKEKDHEMIKLRKHTQMQFAINKLPFIDAELTLLATEKFIKYEPDINDFIVVNEKGLQRYNSSGEPMSVDEFYNEYIQQKKHLARSEALSGLGSSESKTGGQKRYKIEELFGPTSDPKKTQILKKTDPVRYNEMREQAKEQKLI